MGDSLFTMQEKKRKRSDNNCGSEFSDFDSKAEFEEAQLRVE